MMWKLTIFAVVIGSIATTTSALPKLPSSLSSISHSHKQSSKPSFVSQKQIDNAVITDVVGDDLDETDDMMSLHSVASQQSQHYSFSSLMMQQLQQTSQTLQASRSQNMNNVM